MDRFWLFEWLDEFGITTKNRADKALADKALRDRILEADLIHRAKRIHAQPPKEKAPLNSILVGRGLDFSNSAFQCPSIECRKRQVNELFSLVWHYFDKIIVADDFTSRLAHIDENRLSAQTRKDLAEFLELLIYLKRIGADTIVDFEPKPIILENEYERVAKLTHLESVLSSEIELTEVFVQNYFPTVKKNNSGMHVSFSFEDGKQGFLFPKVFPKAEAIKLAAHKLFRYNIAALASDLRAAAQLGVPLGAAAVPQNLLLSKTLSTNEAQVAMSLNLPILRNLSAADLIRIRQENADAFHQFRRVLKAAIAEKLKIAENSNSGDIAKEIENDLIKPGIDEIARRLRIAETIVNKKAFIAVVFGTLATVCGVLAGAGPTTAIAAGVATTSALAGKGSMEYVDAASNIESDKLFFLWKALKHRHQ